MKRLFDIIFSLIGLILFSPLFALVAILIKLDSPSPIFFVQKRIGRGFKPFNLYKFRTMMVGADKKDLPITAGGDPRVAKIGRFLRRTKIDELPQLINVINVIKGDISFVGPRPALFNQNDLIALRTKKGIHKLVPGLTEWAQINGRDDLPIPKKVEYDEYYLKHRSFIFDLKIIFMTFFKVIRGEGVKH